jgi:hypothetical protein
MSSRPCTRQAAGRNGTQQGQQQVKREGDAVCAGKSWEVAGGKRALLPSPRIAGILGRLLFGVIFSKCYQLRNRCASHHHCLDKQAQHICDSHPTVRKSMLWQESIPALPPPSYLLQVNDRNVSKGVCNIWRVRAASRFPDGQGPFIQRQCCR